MTRTCARSCGLDGHTQTQSTEPAWGHDVDPFVEKTRTCKRVSCNHIQTAAPPTNWTAVTGGEGEGWGGPITIPGQSTFGEVGILGITYGNGKFVAVGNRGRMAWSNDGINWIAITGGVGGDGPENPVTIPGQSTFGASGINSIIYDNGRFFAVGLGRMAWSQDGINWTAVTGGEGNWDNFVIVPGDSTFGVIGINGIAYGNGKYVAVGGFGRMAWSQDGINWTAVTGGEGGRYASETIIVPGQSTFGTANISGITYGNGKFVAVGHKGRMAWSEDGINWTAVTGGVGGADGQGSVTVPGNSTFGEAPIQSITYGNGKFVAVGYFGRMAWSQDGINWTAVTGGEGWNPITVPGQSTFGGNIILDITYGCGMFIAVGTSGRMAWSEDLITWTAITGGEGGPSWMGPITVPGQSTFGGLLIESITYGNGKFIAVAGMGRMAWSEIVPLGE